MPTKHYSTGQIVRKLRRDEVELGRQISAADSLQIPYVLILGPDEVERQIYTLKNLATGEQQTLAEDALIAVLRS